MVNDDDQELSEAGFNINDADPQIGDVRVSYPGSESEMRRALPPRWTVRECAPTVDGDTTPAVLEKLRV